MIRPIPVEVPEDAPRLLARYGLAEARADAAAASVGLPSGFPELDDAGVRFGAGRVHIIAGRPGSGKTAFLLEIVARAAAVEARNDAPAPVVMVSYESNRYELYVRLVVQECGRRRIESGLPGGAPGIDHRTRWLRGEHPPDEIAAELDGAAEEVDRLVRCGALVLVDGDREGGEVDILVAALEAAAAARGGPPALVVLDYAQKIRPPREMRGASRQEQLAHVSDLIRQYAKGNTTAFAVPVVLGAQVNREAKDGQPRLHHVREADDLANDASTVLTIYRPDDTSTLMEVAIEKNRDGPSGGTPTPLGWDGPSMHVHQRRGRL